VTFPGVSHWFNPLDFRSQRSSAPTRGAAVLAPSDDRAIETSIPARLDSLRRRGRALESVARPLAFVE
jgi:hypothetical protein